MDTKSSFELCSRVVNSQRSKSGCEMFKLKLFGIKTILDVRNCHVKKNNSNSNTTKLFTHLIMETKGLICIE